MFTKKTGTFTAICDFGDRTSCINVNSAKWQRTQDIKSTNHYFWIISKQLDSDWAIMFSAIKHGHRLTASIDQ
jgi:hypothetical protein